MRMRWLALFAFFVSVPALAQTDQDLFAAYCLGVLQTTPDVIDDSKPRTCNIDPRLCKELDDVFRRGDEQRRSDIFRLQRYLAAKGYQSGAVGSRARETGLAAINAGKQDQAICAAVPDARIPFNLCQPHCADPRSKDCEFCMNDRLDPACKRRNRCLDLSSLPF
jgi:hypothetical protein